VILLAKAIAECPRRNDRRKGGPDEASKGPRLQGSRWAESARLHSRVNRASG
jgi:hypothetical protein